MEEMIMAEIKDLEKNVAEGELTDEELDGAAGGTSFFSTTETYRKAPISGARTNEVSDKSENC
jgi:hypothetical protein